MPVPELDDVARRRALDRAVEARRIRAHLKDMLRTGELTLAELFARADREEVVGRTRVVEVLEAMPGVGKVRAQRLMEQLDISPSRRLRGLGVHQRAALLRHFGEGP